MGDGALLPQRFRHGEGAVVEDGRVMLFEHDVLALVQLDVLAVDFCARIFALAEGADIEIVFQNPLNGGDGPFPPDFPAARFAVGLPAQLLGHARRRNARVREVIGDFLVPPAVRDVKPVDLPHDFRLGGDDLKLPAFCEEVAVGRGADPFALLLAMPDDVPDLLGGVGDGHFVDHELELDFQPVVVVGKIDAVADGDDAHALVAQVFQLHQTAPVAA